MSEKKGLTLFIVDDNAMSLRTLADDLRLREDVKEVYTFSNYTDATLPLIEIQPDALFLDVEVPGKTGLEFLDSIRPRVNFSFKAIFYTAFSNYMIDAIRQQAFDFLLKPYKQSELNTVMERLVEQVPTTKQIKGLGLDDTPQRMAMQTMSELLLVSMEQTLMFEYQSDFRTWQLTLTDRSTHLLKKGVTADDLLALNPTYMRISNTCIINLTYLAAIENNSQRCRMCPPFDDIGLTVSRRYYSKLKEKIRTAVMLIILFHA